MHFCRQGPVRFWGVGRVTPPLLLKLAEKKKNITTNEISTHLFSLLPQPRPFINKTPQIKQVESVQRCGPRTKSLWLLTFPNPEKSSKKN